MKKLNLAQMSTSVKVLDQTSLNTIKGGVSDPPPYGVSTGGKMAVSDPPPYGVSTGGKMAESDPPPYGTLYGTYGNE